MNIDLSKLVTITSYNSFKNVNVYTGSLTLPTSIPPDSAIPTQTSTTITLTDIPVFLSFFAFYNDSYNATVSINDPQWYNAAASGDANVAYPATNDPVNGNISCFFYPVIDGNIVTIVARGLNQTATTYHANISVPFAFVEYTLAN
jgi:hypothetical protein